MTFSNRRRLSLVPVLSLLDSARMYNHGNPVYTRYIIGGTPAYTRVTMRDVVRTPDARQTFCCVISYWLVSKRSQWSCSPRELPKTTFCAARKEIGSSFGYRSKQRSLDRRRSYRRISLTTRCSFLYNWSLAKCRNVKQLDSFFY